MDRLVHAKWLWMTFFMHGFGPSRLLFQFSSQMLRYACACWSMECDGKFVSCQVIVKKLPLLRQSAYPAFRRLSEFSTKCYGFFRRIFMYCMVMGYWYSLGRCDTISFISGSSYSCVMWHISLFYSNSNEHCSLSKSNLARTDFSHCAHCTCNSRLNSTWKAAIKGYFHVRSTNFSMIPRSTDTDFAEIWYRCWVWRKNRKSKIFFLTTCAFVARSQNIFSYSGWPLPHFLLTP